MVGHEAGSAAALETARHWLVDSLACAFRALDDPACARLLGPLVPGATLPGGARVPGTPFELDPVQAAFNIGTLLRWLDSNDGGLAAGSGHPADTLGATLAVADYLSRQRVAEGGQALAMRDVLSAMVKGRQVQDAIAGCGGADGAGADHARPVRAASAAMATSLLGGTREQVVSALSHAWLDGRLLAAVDTAARRRWAVGDATSRGVRLALLALAGEPGRPVEIHAPTGLSADLGLGPAAGDQGLAGNFGASVKARLTARQYAALESLCADPPALEGTPVDDFMALLVCE